MLFGEYVKKCLWSELKPLLDKRFNVKKVYDFIQKNQDRYFNRLAEQRRPYAVYQLQISHGELPYVSYHKCATIPLTRSYRTEGNYSVNKWGYCDVLRLETVADPNLSVAEIVAAVINATFDAGYYDLMEEQQKTEPFSAAWYEINKKIYNYDEAREKENNTWQSLLNECNAPESVKNVFMNVKQQNAPKDAAAWLKHYNWLQKYPFPLLTNHYVWNICDYLLHLLPMALTGLNKGRHSDAGYSSERLQQFATVDFKPDCFDDILNRMVFCFYEAGKEMIYCEKYPVTEE
jgi:hypothetical protein